MMAGGCQCGAVRYAIDGKALRSALCACADCRRSSGAPMVAWALFPREAVAVEGTPVAYNSSGDGQRIFCGRCGTGLFYESSTKLPGLVNLRSATLDDPDQVAPQAWVQMAEAPQWLNHADALPKFERYTPR